MSVKVTVSVTKDDIEHGRSADPQFCPIARAVKRTLNAVLVGIADARITVWPGGGQRDRYFCPMSVDKFVSTFDDPETRPAAKPFAFETWLLEEDAA